MILRPIDTSARRAALDKLLTAVDALRPAFTELLGVADQLRQETECAPVIAGHGLHQDWALVAVELLRQEPGSRQDLSIREHAREILAASELLEGALTKLTPEEFAEVAARPGVVPQYLDASVPVPNPKKF